MFFVMTRHPRVSATPTRLYRRANTSVSSYGIHYFSTTHHSETLHLARGMRSDGIGEDEGGRTLSSAVGPAGESASINHNSANSKKKKQEKDRRQKGISFIC
ncbi:hypothetical protein L208DRAFT_946369 [Tricholoma matsutake]|nr:hypothetical protein L208DRAFT_946369 [Tricholoma matsutake 945]